MKHTKGKWYPVQYCNFWDIQDGESYEDNSILNTEHVGEEEAYTNAKLISKAPEMYEALKWAYKVLSRVDHSYTERNTPEGQMKLSDMRFIIKELS